jgi:shikimate dehydrogenase
MIDGKTQLVGLVGWPVEHSLSPAMHNAAFEAMGLNWRYLPLPVRPGQVEAAVRGLAALNFRGVNVTVPHKAAVIPLLDHRAEEVRALGAANALLFGRDDDGVPRVSGFNTDETGFIQALREGGFEPGDGGQAVILGAGGGARAAVHGLLRAGIERVVVLNRNLPRAQRLIVDLGCVAEDPSRLEGLPLTAESLVEAARAADLLVNATPVGMWPHGDESVWPADIPFPAHLTVLDLVYNPLQTRLLRQASGAGARTIDGLGMLLYQGAAAFEIWTGRPPPIEVMRAACHGGLGR